MQLMHGAPSGCKCRIHRVSALTAHGWIILLRVSDHLTVFRAAGPHSRWKLSCSNAQLTTRF